MDKIQAKLGGDALAEHDEEVVDINLDELSYGPKGLRGVFSSSYVTVCAGFSAIGGLLFGYDQGLLSVTLTMDQFLERFYEIEESYPGSGFYKGLVTAMITLGAALGAFNAGWLADWLSRKYAIMVSVVIFIIGSILQTAAVNYGMLTAGRFIGGMGMGVLSVVAPMYISEISPPEIRGTLLTFQELSIVVGIVVSYWVSFGTRYIQGSWSWQLPFVLQIAPAVFLGAGAILLPFSPRWLAKQEREEDALLELAKLRQLPTNDNRVQREWMEIIAESKFQRKVMAERHPTLTGTSTSEKAKLELASWLDCFKKGCLKRTHVGTLIMFFQQFIGINALIYYSPTLFGTMGLDYEMQLILSGVLNVTQLVGVATSLWTLDRFGRRNMLLFGAFSMGVAHLVIAVLVGKFSYDWKAHTTEGWVSVAFLFLFMLAFGATWGPVPWALPSEIFPSSLRGKGVALSTTVTWLANFVIGLITPPLIQDTGYGAYVFFAVFCVLAFTWTFLVVPETSGKTLEQMDEVFKDRSNSADIATKQQILFDVVREKTQGGRRWDGA